MTTIYDIVGWRVWYTEGRKYDSKDTYWEQLPSSGVILFVLYQREKERRRLMLGVSLYWKDGEIYACDNAADAIIRNGLPPECIKRGKWVTDGEYGDALKQASLAVLAPDESDRI